jgi:hypothetical protein
MRNLVVTENITLDGVVDASEGWFAPSWGGGYWKAETRGLPPVHSGIVLTRYGTNR